MDTRRDRALSEMRGTRENLERELSRLIEARAACRSQLESEHRADLVEKVTGRSSLDRAIEDTKRMIEVLRRAEEQGAREGGEQAGGGETSHPENAYRLGPVPELKLAGTPMAMPRRIDVTRPVLEEHGADADEEIAVAGMVHARLAGTSRRAGVLFASKTSPARFVVR